eukprot:9438112-Pyramimonas_sp.AAC.1
MRSLQLTCEEGQGGCSVARLIAGSYEHRVTTIIPVLAYTGGREDEKEDLATHRDMWRTVRKGVERLCCLFTTPCDLIPSRGLN